jgi:hypothetical protein
MITGFFTGLFLTMIVVAWKYSNTIKSKILVRFSGKTEISNIDLDNLFRFAVFIVIFLIGAVPLTIIMINTTD